MSQSPKRRLESHAAPCAQRAFEVADDGIATKSSSASLWSPFRHRPYAIIWTATLVSNIGGWMYSSTSAWLMTSLDSSP